MVEFENGLSTETSQRPVAALLSLALRLVLVPLLQTKSLSLFLFKDASIACSATSSIHLNAVRLRLHESYGRRSSAGKSFGTPMDGEARSDSRFFPLTGLQIGDLQCYLSRLTLFLAIGSNKFLILVDNQPWLIDKEARPAHFWQLMVTKSRLSPFANTKTRSKSRDYGRTNLRNVAKSKIKKTKYQWFSLISAVLRHKASLSPMKKLKDSLLLNSDLRHTLYGFIVFEVSWDQVRGINYLNELQTDTSLALEAKVMKRWEFDSIIQASDCISSWFTGIPYECRLLQEYLDGVSLKGEVFYDAQNDLRDSSLQRSDYVVDKSYNGSCNFCLSRDELGANSCETPPICGSYKRRKITKSMSVGSGLDGFSDEVYSEIVSSPTYFLDSKSSSSSDNEAVPMSFEAAHYSDVLILFRFSDPDLPFCLRKIIVSDLRLLTLLEYGLPSWVIFLQSYPVFCRIYRPWMCPLARALYVLVSMATVLIGFFDLYKNVPVLRSTASRLCGPFFEWVESWEMISRIKYLGTMLFLHNFEKSVAWFLMTTRAIKSLVLVLSKPLAGPLLNLTEFLLPSWNIFVEIVEMLSSVIFSLVGSASALVLSLVQILLWPFWIIMSVLWAIATSIVYPVFWLLWEILTIPFHLVAETCNYVLVICSYPYFFVRSAWSSVYSVVKLASSTKVTVEAYEVPIWRSLWNDLFSQVFRAIRSILYGFIAFFAACNRHRLSIYNYFREFLVNFSYDTARQGLLNSSNMPGPRSPSLPRETRTRGKKPRQHKKKLA